MKRRADALRALWIGLIALYAVLVINSWISGVGTAVYVLFTMAVIAGEAALRRRLKT